MGTHRSKTNPNPWWSTNKRRFLNRNINGKPHSSLQNQSTWWIEQHCFTCGSPMSTLTNSQEIRRNQLNQTNVSLPSAHSLISVGFLPRWLIFNHSVNQLLVYWPLTSLHISSSAPQPWKACPSSGHGSGSKHSTGHPIGVSICLTMHRPPTYQAGML